MVLTRVEGAMMRSDGLYPGDEGQLHARVFQCRDGLWDTFQQLAREQGISMDDILDEAMVAYARARGHMEMATAKRKPPTAAMAAHGQGQRLPVDDETMDRPDDLRRLMQGRPSSRGQTAPPPAVRPMTMPSPAHQVPPPPTRSRVPPGPPSGRSMPPPLPPAGIAPPPQTQRLNAPGALVLTYHGQPYNVDKDRYLLGRSKTQADLRLEDANVSRQHAMIERVGNAWYVVDLGSTNGVYVQGERVARRALRDGDVIEITTHRIDVQLR